MKKIYYIQIPIRKLQKGKRGKKGAKQKRETAKGPEE